MPVTFDSKMIWRSPLQKSTILLSSRELIEHFTNHFNPPLTKADEIPHELTTDISGFVNQLQELSCQYLFLVNIYFAMKYQLLTKLSTHSLSRLQKLKKLHDIPPEISKHARHSSKFMELFMKLAEQV